jgi:hypothetical protein
LNLLNEKLAHLTIATPSARMPAQMLKANITTSAYTNPFVGVKYPNNGLTVDMAINRHCSKLNSFSMIIFLKTATKVTAFCIEFLQYTVTKHWCISYQPLQYIL